MPLSDLYSTLSRVRSVPSSSVCEPAPRSGSASRDQCQSIRRRSRHREVSGNGRKQSERFDDELRKPHHGDQFTDRDPALQREVSREARNTDREATH